MSGWFQGLYGTFINEGNLVYSCATHAGSNIGPATLFLGNGGANSVSESPYARAHLPLETAGADRRGLHRRGRVAQTSYVPVT